MTEWKEGDKAWMCAVWSKTKKRNKVNAQITEVVINKLFDDGSCLVSDPEDTGMYDDVKNLHVTKEHAVLNTLIGIRKWSEQEITQGEQE